MDTIKTLYSNRTTLFDFVIKYKYHIVIGILVIAVLVLYTQKSTCQKLFKKIKEQFSNNEIYSWAPIQVAQHQHADLTPTTDDHLMSGTAERHVSPSGVITITVDANLYLLNKNVFGETVEQEYTLVVSTDSGDKHMELGALVYDNSQTYKFKIEKDVSILEYTKINIFHTLNRESPKTTLILSGRFS